MGRLERVGTMHLGHRRLLSRLSGLQWLFVVRAVGSTAACRIQNFAGACPHVPPSVRLAGRFQCRVEVERWELPCTEPE